MYNQDTGLAIRQITSNNTSEQIAALGCVQA